MTGPSLSCSTLDDARSWATTCGTAGQQKVWYNDKDKDDKWGILVCTRTCDSKMVMVAGNLLTGIAGVPLEIPTYSGSWSGYTDCGSQAQWGPCNQEVLKVFTNSTVATSHVERMAHGRTDNNRVLNAICAGSFISYWAIPEATQSLDGTKVLFNSTWGPTCSASTFLLPDVEPAPGVGGSLQGGKLISGGKRQ